MVARVDFDAQDVVFNVPLYDWIEVTSDTQDYYLCLFNFGDTKIDGHCHLCGKDSVFHSKGMFQSKIFSLSALVGIKKSELYCTRDPAHTITMFLETCLLEEGGDRWLAFRKVGQVPSHADIANGGVSQFSRDLEKVDRAELTRANGLAAHGVHIGAYVYLRRVFERLIWRAKSRSIDQMEDASFTKLRMDEKIGALSTVVPKFLSDNKKIYSVLSKGIHELDEATCGKYYELMKMSIFLMLEQEREIRERQEREKSLTSLISEIKI